MFQSTRPHGARPDARLLVKLNQLSFNPRARMGRDAYTIYSTHRHTRFNPRARMGRDPDWRRVADVDLSVSIHAPAWGATSDVWWS